MTKGFIDSFDHLGIHHKCFINISDISISFKICLKTNIIMWV